MTADTPVTRLRREEHETRLAKAARHVAEARLIVARQRQRIARLKAQGSSTRAFEVTLDLFMSTLRILEEHERDLREAATKPGPKPLPLRGSEASSELGKSVEIH